MDLEMEEVKRGGPRLEDVVDLIHRIQSFLPVKEAARTCVLSKSWKRAWYTIPTLRFDSKEQKTMHFIDRTVSRYNQDNIPTISFELRITIENQESSSLANICIRTVATQRCLKELSLKICNSMSSEFILMDEIFSGENLQRLEVYRLEFLGKNNVWVTRNSVINCVSLRVLKFSHVKVSEEVLDSLFSTCTLLEKIELIFLTSLTKIKVQNMRYLQEFKLVSSEEEYITLEVDDVPNLETFGYKCYGNLTTFNIDSLSRVTKLSLFDVIVDVAFFDNIKSKLHFLEILELEFRYRGLKRLDITSASLKKLSLGFLFGNWKIDVQVYAPKLLHLFYYSPAIPNLSFQSYNTPGKIQLRLLKLGNSADNHRLYKMRELLNLSSEFDIDIKFDFYYKGDVLDMDIDYLKGRFPFPATNVHRLSFLSDNWVHVHPSYFDALFTICYPNYVWTDTTTKNYDGLVSELMKRKTFDLKHIEFKDPCSKKWEHLTDSSLDGKSDGHYGKLKLNWCSL